MDRVIELEWLDALSPDDPAAAGSRRDLRWLNACMGHGRILACLLQPLLQSGRPHSLLEIGAGDGSLMLKVLRQVAPGRATGRLCLLEQHPLYLEPVRAGMARLGWRMEAIQANVFDWLRTPTNGLWDTTVANLFLHHFSQPQLSELFDRLASRTRAFIAIEPRRSALSLAFTRMVWLLGCNHVTRHDAPASVRAGFENHELSELWPAAGEWVHEEKSAGFFSHVFIARRANESQTHTGPDLE